MSQSTTIDSGFTVELAQIRVEGRVRQPRAARVAILRESIRNDGLKKKIVVAAAPAKRDGTRFVLVAGLVRLLAMRELQVESCQAVLKPKAPAASLRQAEIDDNLLDDDGLTVLERGRCFAAARAIYEEAHPGTGRGGDRRSDQSANLAACPGFTEWAADRYGRSDRAIRRLCQIGEAVDAAAGVQLADHDAADRQTEMLALARLGPDVQQQVAQLLTASENPADTVAEAVARIEGRVEQPELFTVYYTRIIGTWARLDLRQKKQVLGEFIHSVPRDWIDEALAAPVSEAA